MDQLRKALGWLKRQHFWVLCGLVAIVAIALWWRAAAAMRQEFTANLGAIEAEFGKMSQLKGTPFHPNDVINTRQGEEIKKQGEEVAKTWQQLYDRQREKVLEWPASLTQEFRDFVENRRFEAEIPPHLRNDYQNYAERYFPELPKIVGARELEPTDSGGGAFGGRGGEYGGGGYGARGGMEGAAMMTPEGEDADKYVCEWLDQQWVRDELNFPNRPNSIRIWVTQEDLWVLKTLLNVIKNTNDAVGATRKSNAAVKTICSLEIGKNAAPYSRSAGRVYRLPSAAPSADMMLGAAPGMEGTAGAEAGMMGSEGAGRYGDRGGESSYGSMGGDSRMGGEAQMTEAQERGFLLNRRYLGPDGKPIAVAGGEMAMPGGEMDMAAAVDPAAAAAPAESGGPSEFGVEYKRLPVRMCLRMDQRMLTFLISECANQPLQVEVQEVRINPADFASGGGGGGGFLGGGGGRYEGGGGGAAPPFPDRTGIQTFSAQPNLVNVVVQGIIYIFNEPDTAVLKPAEQEAAPLANM